MSTEGDGTPRLGSMFGRYRIESIVGRGGMGVVVRATDTVLDRQVALKFLAPELRGDARMRERFLREPRLAAAVEHASIVPIHEAGEIDGVPYIAMRAVPGADLSVLLRREAPLSSDRTLAIIVQVADALDAAHAAALVHRDVKPGNVILEPADSQGREHAWLTDFGLTRRVHDVTLATGPGTIGTLEYIAPEIIAGDTAGPASDQYGLACLAVQCLSGRPPWPGATDAAVLNGHLHGDRAEVARRVGGGAMGAALERGLAIDPAARFPDCRSLARAMAGPDAVAAAPTRPLAPVPTPSPDAPRRRPPAWQLIGAFVLIATLVAVAAMMALADEAGTPSPSPGASTAPIATVPAVVGSPSPVPSPSPSASPAPSPSASPSPSPSEMPSPSRSPIPSEVVSVDVPKVSGNTPARASKTLEAAGLVVDGRREVWSDDVDVDRVVGTRPAAGTPVEPGRSIELVVSKGIEPVIIGGDPPANDRLLDAPVIGRLPYRAIVWTTRAGTALQEQVWCGEMTATVWFKYRPARDQRVTLSTARSGFDTAIALWSGTELADARIVECATDSPQDPTTRASLTVVLQAGVSYMIQVGGDRGATGRLDFQMVVQGR